MKVQTSTDKLARQLESSNTNFKRDVLDKSVHIVILSRSAVKTHAKAQVEAVLDRLDKRRVRDSAIQGLADLLYTTLQTKLTSFSSPNIAFRRLSSGNAADAALLKNAGQKVSGSSVAFRARPTGSTNVYAALNAQVFMPANKKAATYLNQFLLTQASRLSIRNGIIDIAGLFASTGNSFKATIRSLLQAGERVPKQRRAAYKAAIRNLATQEVRKSVTSSRNKDWSVSVQSNFDISSKKILSNSVVLLSSANNLDDPKREEKAAVAAITKIGKEFFEDAVANPNIVGKIEQSLLNATISAIKGKKSKYRKKGKGSGNAKLRGTTKVSPVIGRGSVWTETVAPGVSQVKELLAIKNILNLFLPLYMQRNMGKGNSKTLLNYRTGRLARSAVVESIQPSRNSSTMFAKVDYMRPPYDTFAAGGEKDMPRTRDPKRLVDRSIRQILKEKLQLAMAFESELI